MSNDIYENREIMAKNYKFLNAIVPEIQAGIKIVYEHRYEDNIHRKFYIESFSQDVIKTGIVYQINCEPFADPVFYVDCNKMDGTARVSEVISDTLLTSYHTPVYRKFDTSLTETEEEMRANEHLCRLLKSIVTEIARDPEFLVKP